jgi:electron transfer flavoprotein beta subunit
VRTVGRYDLILAGRQAIDGDTAQVGPQLAGALGIPQITYVKAVLELAPGRLRAHRLIEGGYEIVDAALPALLTVVGEANEPRPRRAKRMMHYRHARTALEVREAIALQLDPEKGKPDPARLEQHAAGPLADLERRGLLIPTWAPADVGADAALCGAAGSPTKVKTIESVVLTASEHQRVEPDRESLAALMHELIEDHVLD